MDLHVYVVRFENAVEDKVLTETVARRTFAEAASWAYVRRHDFGFEWKVISIKEREDKNGYQS